MKRKFRLGKFGGLEVYLRGNVFIGAAIIWAILISLAIRLLELPPTTAVWVGFLGMLMHYGSEFWHQYSHAWAARRTGYPMEGMMFFWVIAMSLYPKDEPELPPKTHIRRALGGPIGNLALALFAGIITWALYPFGGLLYWFAMFLFLENLFVFSLGALLPLGFTDGSALLKWWGRGKET